MFVCGLFDRCSAVVCHPLRDSLVSRKYPVHDPNESAYPATW